MPDLTQPAPLTTVGSSPLRKEGAAKVLGQAKYVDDITLPNMWFGATVRSTIARGRILSIDFDPAIPWHEFTIVTAADIPGKNCIVHLTEDHLCLASTHVNHPNEPITTTAYLGVAIVIFGLVLLNRKAPIKAPLPSTAACLDA